jgi:hypothetical protein
MIDDTFRPAIHWADNRHWFRARFHQRYRLFFRFSGKDHVIAHLRVNDTFTLRKASSEIDADAVDA